MTKHTNLRLAILIALHGVAILSTVFRLVHRFRIRRIWWDDFWAGIAMVAAAFLIPLLIVSGHTHLPLAMRNLCRWSAIFVFTTVLWSSRISIAVTIVRMLPPSGMRRIAKGVLFVFAIMILALVVQKVFICGKFSKPVVNCPIPRSTGILELCTNIIADTWLLGAPIYLVIHMKLPPGHKRLLMCIFGTSVLTTAAGVTQGAFILMHDGRKVGTSAHLEAAIALIVCNLLVVATYIYRVFWIPSEPNNPSASLGPFRQGSSESDGTASTNRLTDVTWTEVSIHGTDSERSTYQFGSAVETGTVTGWSGRSLTSSHANTTTTGSAPMSSVYGHQIILIGSWVIEGDEMTESSQGTGGMSSISG